MKIHGAFVFKKNINILSWLLLTGMICSSLSIVVACSSNPVQKVNNTTFISEYSISQETDLKNFIPTECKTYFINNRATLLSLIFNKIILGHKINIDLDQINFNINDAVPNNDTATLAITYEIKTYWVNNIFVNESPKILTVTLIDFKRVTNPTIFVDSKILIVTNSALAAHTVNDVINNKAILTKWIFENEIIGNKQNLSENNISVSFSNINKVDGRVTVTYELNSYWSERGLTNTPVKRFSIAFSGFVKMEQTDEEILAEINGGGTTDSLQINQYLSVIKSLNINNSIRLNTIDQTYLDQIKKIPDFEDLNLTIVDGNQNNNSLVLKLTGQYQHVNIPEAQSLIIITGFKNIASTYGIASTMWINIMYLNSDKYYTDLQTKQSMQLWSNDQWLNYLEDFRCYAGGGFNLNILDAFQNKVISSIIFENISEAITQDDWTLFTLKFDYINYKYTNNNWVEDTKENFSYIMENRKQLTYLTDKDVMEYIGSKHVDLIVEQTASRYASYWYVQTQIAPESINTILEIEQIYLQTYFANRQLIIELAENSMRIDDWNGTFSFSYKLVLPDDFDSPYNETSMEVVNCLKLSSYVIDNTQDITYNIAQVKAFDPPPMVARIIKSVKQEFTNEEINALVINQQMIMRTNPEYFRAQSTSYTIYNSSASIDKKFDDSLINNIADFKLFNQIVNSSLINVDSNVFDRKINGGFYLDTLRVRFEDTAQVFLTKINNQLFQYKVPFKYELGILGHTEDIDGFYFYNVSLDELGYN